MNKKTIDSYFTALPKKRKVNEAGMDEQPPCSKKYLNIAEQEKSESEVQLYDIGNAVKKRQTATLTDFESYKFLKNTWTPPLDYGFPYSEHNKSNKVIKRYIGHQHIIILTDF